MGRQEAVYSFSKDGRGATYALEGEKALVVRMCQKRPIAVSKETYYRVKKDLFQCHKRPITVSKETYYMY